ncbi:MAG: histidine phosphatase family protein, partial [Chloroflexota bacterium]|nr:histidine phosphatase family protein [Chloroflexota bacterium]
YKRTEVRSLASSHVWQENTINMKLLLVRHGATPNNLQERYTGQADVELSTLGEQQALAVGERLAHQTLDTIVASDLKRARDTAQAIAAHHALPVLEDPNLREIALGSWEGATFAEVAARDAALVSRWLADASDCAPPGGETATQVRERIVVALGSWQVRYPAGTVLWVTHGGFTGILLCHVLGMDLSRRRQFRGDNASITELDLGETLPRLLCFNETAHLRHPTHVQTSHTTHSA